MHILKNEHSALFVRVFNIICHSLDAADCINFQQENDYEIVADLSSFTEDVIEFDAKKFTILDHFNNAQLSDRVADALKTLFTIRTERDEDIIDVTISYSLINNALINYLMQISKLDYYEFLSDVCQIELIDEAQRECLKTELIEFDHSNSENANDQDFTDFYYKIIL